MRVSSQIASQSAPLSQPSNAVRSKLQQEQNLTSQSANQNAEPKQAQPTNRTEQPVKPPLVSSTFDSPANLILESMHALVKAEANKGPANSEESEASASLTGGPQNLDIQDLPTNDLDVPVRVDLSALSRSKTPAGTDMNSEWTQGLKQDASPTSLAKLSDNRFNVNPVQVTDNAAGGPQSLSLSPPESFELFISNEIELQLTTTELSSPNNDSEMEPFINGPSIDPEQGMRPEIKNLYAVMKRISEGTSYEFTNYEANEDNIQPNRNYTNSLDVIGVGREPTAIFLSQAS